MLTAAASFPSSSQRPLPLALIASTLFHAAIGLALALWLVPGQQSSLPSGEVPISVVMRSEPDNAPAMAPMEARPAPVFAERVQMAVQSATSAVATSEAASQTIAPSLQVPSIASAPSASTPRASATSRPVSAVATGTTTLVIDSGVPANVAFEALAARGLGTDFPVEVGKLVRVRSVPAITYPASALEREKEGSILALVIVDEKGMPYNISLMEFDPEFVAAAETAIRGTRFMPAEDMNGTPIMFFTVLRINFLRSTPGSAGTPSR